MDKEIQPIIFVIETSGGMAGPQIETVSGIMTEVLSKLARANAAFGGQGKQLKIAVLTFATDCRWLTKGLVPPEDFIWEVPPCHGLAYHGKAFAELSDKMSRGRLFAGENITAAPIIIFFSYREPQDDYRKGTKLLWANEWFVHTQTFSVALSEDVLDVLYDSAGMNRETSRNRYEMKFFPMAGMASYAILNRQALRDAGVQKPESDFIMRWIEAVNFGTPFALEEFTFMPLESYSGYGFYKSFWEKDGRFFIEEAYYD
ncbi:MAG: hypothetical protein FWH02_03125 [Oscillospiraceae bacterium]|nr:hypothetical protein [Oscillospiraceae bacterium]